MDVNSMNFMRQQHQPKIVFCCIYIFEYILIGREVDDKKKLVYPTFALELLHLYDNNMNCE